MPASIDLTIATYNILFAINAKRIIDNIEQMADSGVEVFCLQEVINTANEKFIISSILKRLGNDWQAAYHVGPEVARDSIGTAIIWKRDKLKIQNEDKILLPKINKFNHHENLFYKVIGATANPLQRKALCCDFLFDKTPVRITCVHLDNVGGPKHRLQQLSYLASHLESKQETTQEIICGDFNTFDLFKTGYEKMLLHKTLGESYVDASHNIRWTADIYNLDFSKSNLLFKWLIRKGHIHIRRKLDYIWVKNIFVDSCYKPLLPGSDHFPVVAKLKLTI